MSIVYIPNDSSLNGNNYWALVMLPQNTNNINAVVNDLQKYAYVFPQNTYVEWYYNENNSYVYTDYLIEVDVKEGV